MDALTMIAAVYSATGVLISAVGRWTYGYWPWMFIVPWVVCGIPYVVMLVALLCRQSG
jgi:hypothetical protein